LGQGGFGVTYFAWDLTLDRAVAIKEYLPAGQCTRLTNRLTVQSQDGERREQYAYGLERFLDEARILARFAAHPSIVPVVNFVEANGTAYLVMNYLQGMNLKEHISNRGGRITYTIASAIMMRAMDALREVHQQGLLHRDISPDNIFLTSDGCVKLIDFGAARHALSEHSQTLSVILKPGYSPEEQYRTKGKQGPWSDVYALGATLYRCVTGIVPPSAIDRLADDELHKPSLYCADLPAPAEIAILKAMSVRAADRYQSVAEFQAALRIEPGEVPGSNHISEPPLPDFPPAFPTTAQPSQPISVRVDSRPAMTWAYFAASVIVVGILGWFVARQASAFEFKRGEEAFKAFQFMDAFRDFQISGHLGNSQSAMYLGVMHRDGLGVRRNYAEAYRWSEKAASAGEGRAMNLLGVLYATGNGVHKSYSLARMWWERASPVEFRATFNLGRLYEQGWGVEPDSAKANQMFSKTKLECDEEARKGNADAMFHLGLLYEFGYGVTRSNSLALDWLQKAAAGGSIGGMLALGDLYYFGDGATQDYTRARSWYQKVADTGYPDGMTRLGDVYSSGERAPLDGKAAQEWYEKAADAGSVDAMFKLGLRFDDGISVPRDQTQAQLWYEKAAEGGSVEAMLKLAERYRTGLHVQQDQSMARTWKDQAVTAFTAPSDAAGAVAGFVTDPSGAAVAGAKIIVTNIANQKQHLVTTDESGIYQITLSPDIYRLEVCALGFKSMNRAQVTVTPLAAMRADWGLEVGPSVCSGSAVVTQGRALARPTVPTSPTLLYITCDVECRRYVDGEAEPAGDIKLAPGRYAIKVVMASDPSVYEERNVTVAEAETNKVIFALKLKQDAAIKNRQLVSSAVEQAQTLFGNNDYAAALDTLDHAAAIAPDNQDIKRLEDLVLKACRPLGACGPRYRSQQ
jgi:TPR repeat protein